MAAPYSSGEHVCKILLERKAVVDALARICISTLGRSALNHSSSAESRRVQNRWTQSNLLPTSETFTDFHGYRASRPLAHSLFALTQNYKMAGLFLIRRVAWSKYSSRARYIGSLLASILGNLSRSGSVTPQKIFVPPLQLNL